MLRSTGFSGGESRSNATALLEALALTKDAFDRVSQIKIENRGAEEYWVLQIVTKDLDEARDGLLRASELLAGRRAGE